MDDIGDAPTANHVRLQLIQAIGGSDRAVLDTVLEAVAAAAARDPVIIQLRNTIIAGLIRQYWCVRDRLAVDDTVVTVVEVTEAVIYNKNRIVFHYKKSRG